MKNGIWGLALAIVLAFVACDSSNGDAGRSTANARATTTEQPVTQVPDTSAVDGGPPVIPTQHVGQYYSTATSAGDIPFCPDPPDGVIVDPAPTTWHLSTTDLWVDVPLFEIGAAMEGAARHDKYRHHFELGSGRKGGLQPVLDASSLVAQTRYPGPFESWIYIPGWDQLIDFSSGTVALVGLEGFDLQTASIRWVVIPTQDGEFTVSGDCKAVGQFTRIGAYANSIDVEPYETFRAIVTDEKELGAFAAWLQRR